MIKRVLTLGGLIANFFELLATLRPTRLERPFLKVLAAPSFLGGPATKLGQLGPLVAPKGSPYAAVFCFSAVYTPVILLKLLKTCGARVLVNQNGVYYPAWFPRGWEAKNRYLKALNDVADHSFFQSEFAVQCYRRWVGEPPRGYSILHNPVDLTKFLPGTAAAAQAAAVSDELRVLVFSDVSEFSRPLWTHVRGFVAYLKAQPLTPRRVRWTFTGRIHDARVFDELGLDRLGADVESRFNPTPATLGESLRASQVALHLVHNDVCPNKVLECLASGVWIVGGSAGGTKELVGDAGTILEVTAGYEKPSYPEYEKLREALEDVSAKLPAAREAALRRAQDFALPKWHAAVERAIGGDHEQTRRQPRRDSRDSDDV